jgi:hypothetical protein
LLKNREDFLRVNFNAKLNADCKFRDATSRYPAGIPARECKFVTKLFGESFERNDRLLHPDQADRDRKIVFARKEVFLSPREGDPRSLDGGCDASCSFIPEALRSANIYGVFQSGAKNKTLPSAEAGRTK